MNTAAFSRRPPAWCAVTLSPDQVTELEHARLEDEFELLYRSAGSPRGMSLFVLKSFTNYPVYYFTPEAIPHISSILRMYEPIVCKPPSPDEVLLIAGDIQPSGVPLPRSVGPGRYDWTGSYL